MKTILVDDENLALEYLAKQISALKNVQVIGKFNFKNERTKCFSV